MNGPDHYREAERLATEAVRVSPEFNDGPPFDEGVTGNTHAGQLLRLAQVHATLALAAATALGAIRLDEDGMPSVDENAWLVVASAEDIGHGGPE